jgi:hypothetical protein
VFLYGEAFSRPVAEACLARESNVAGPPISNALTVKPGYKDLGYKDNLTNKDTILGPEYICMRNKDNPIPLNILLIGRSLASKHTKFSLTN